MSIATLQSRLPDYAGDLRLNLGSLAAGPGLSVQQRAGTFIACALASRNTAVTAAIAAEFAPQPGAETLAAAKAAAA